MFRAKAGARLRAAIAATVIAATPHVNGKSLPPGAPKSIETIWLFQFSQQYQPSEATRTAAATIEPARSRRESFQILNARKAATSRRLDRGAGTWSRASGSSSFINCPSSAAAPDE